MAARPPTAQDNDIAQGRGGQKKGAVGTRAGAKNPTTGEVDRNRDGDERRGKGSEGEEKRERGVPPTRGRGPVGTRANNPTREGEGGGSAPANRPGRRHSSGRRGQKIGAVGTRAGA